MSGSGASPESAASGQFGGAPQTEPEAGLAERLIRRWSQNCDYSVGIPFRRMATDAEEVALAYVRDVLLTREKITPILMAHPRITPDNATFIANHVRALLGGPEK